MSNRGGLHAWLEHDPWRMGYRLTLGMSAGHHVMAVTGIEDGKLRYERQEDGLAAPLEPFLMLSQDEVDAIVDALKREARPVDAAADAIRDARETRDRLLAMLEARGIR